MRKFLLATTALLALTTASPAAVIGDLGPNPNTGLSRGPGLGVFDDQYTFTLTNTETITLVGILNGYPGGVLGGSFINGFTGSVINLGGDGVIGGGDDSFAIGPVAATATCFGGTVVDCQQLAGVATLAAGAYALDISGDAQVNAAYGGTINTIAAVPESSTWAMMLLGFVGIGLFGMRKNKERMRLC